MAAIIDQGLESGSYEKLAVTSLDEFTSTLVLSGPDGIAAYYLRIDEYPDTLSLDDICAPQGLIPRLAEVHSQLDGIGEIPLKLILITNDLPSPRPFGGSGAHLAGFMDAGWARGPHGSISWQEAWEQIRKASTLADDQFDCFVRDSHFEWAFKPPGDEDTVEGDFLDRFSRRLAEEETGELNIGIDSLENWLSTTDNTSTSANAKIGNKFLGAKKDKNPKEKASWKDVAERSKEQSSRWKESSSESEPVEKNDRKQTSSLRAMMSTAPPEPAAEEPETEKEEPLEEYPEQDKIESGPEPELESKSETELELELEPEPEPEPEPESETEPASEPGTEPIDFSPPDGSGAFKRVTSLGLKQDQEHSDGAVATESAFDGYFNNANDLFDRGNLEDAENDYIRALDLLSRLGEPRPEEETRIIENLGDIYMAQSRPELAVALYEESVEKRVTARVPHRRYMSALLALGDAFEHFGHMPEAERHFRKAVEIGSQNFEDSEPLLVTAKEKSMKLAREKSTVLNRFNTAELERIRLEMKNEGAILKRKPKITGEAEAPEQEIWIKGSQDQIKPGDKESGPPWLALAVGFLVLLGSGFAILVPDNTKSGALLSIAMGNVAHNYRSADDRIKLEVTTDGKALMVNDGLNEYATARLIDSAAGLLGLIPGHLRADHVFFDEEPAGLLTKDGTMLYADESEERALIDKMWTAADLAQRYRNQTLTYPVATGDWASVGKKAEYYNYFEKKTELPEITSSPGANDVYLVEKVESGKLWKGQEEPRAGSIICNTFSGRRFFVRAFDRDKKLIGGAVPEKCFYIELRDNTNITDKALKKLAREASHEHKRKSERFVFVRGDQQAGFLFSLLTIMIPAAMVLSLALLLARLKWKINKGDSSLPDYALPAVLMVLLIVWYIVALLNPN